VFELDIQSPRHIRVHVGRWHFRTWRSHVMKLPEGYVSPEIAYSVELETDADGWIQCGAFFSETPARGLMERLIRDGVDAERLRINVIAIHCRLEDHEWDR